MQMGLMTLSGAKERSNDIILSTYAIRLTQMPHGDSRVLPVCVIVSNGRS